jgi:hypothetical protein
MAFSPFGKGGLKGDLDKIRKILPNLFGLQ